MTQVKPARQPQPHPWWVYETSDRWIRAARRFAPDFELGWTFVKHEIASDLSSFMESPVDPAARRVVLWQVDRDNLASAAAAIAHLSTRHRGDLQIAAINDLSSTIQMSLLELGIATIIRHPEQLPSLKNMIRLHFAGQF